MEESGTKLRLQWRDHGSELAKLSREMFGSEDLTDVTLTCRGGAPFHAHKMVLAAASTFFRNFFNAVKSKMSGCKHILNIMGVSFALKPGLG